MIINYRRNNETQVQQNSNPQTEPELRGLGTTNSTTTSSNQADPVDSHDGQETHRPRSTRRAGLRIGSMNIRGFTNVDHKELGTKWSAAGAYMRERKISILALQETHLSEDRRKRVEKLLDRRFKIASSPLPAASASRAGIAFLISKKEIITDNIKTWQIVPGRAIMIQFKWRGEKSLTILAVYAPNVTKTDGKENAAFYNLVRTRIRERNLPKPDVMLGDHNFVEDAIDRSPPRNDPAECTEEMGYLKSEFNITDAWRRQFPASECFTFHQPSQPYHSSRLDRIYLSSSLEKTACEWTNEINPLAGTDHNVVTVKISPESAPTTGKGRYQVPVRLLNEKRILEDLISELGKLTNKMQEIKDSPQTRSTVLNPQILWSKEFKQPQRSKMRKKDRAVIPIIQEKINQAENRMKELEPLARSQNEDRIANTIKLAEARVIVKKLEREKTEIQARSKRVWHHLEADRVTKYQYAINKTIHPKELIYKLKIPTPNGEETMPQYTNNSAKMASIARDYHSRLQVIDIDPDPDPDEEDEQINRVTAFIDRRVTEQQSEDVIKEITEEEVELAIKKSNAQSASGLDGFTNGIWKTLLEIQKDPDKSKILSKEQAKSVNVTKPLSLLFNDMLKYGIEKEANLTEGWLCPIYKKNDKTEISNYRPITLLNSDYKLFTKIFTNRLSAIAKDIIHENQAGFIKGRQISNQTMLIRMIMKYAKLTKSNGAIVALDQEKAYDKIFHKYLWEVLRVFHFPTTFINTIKHLYNKPLTRIIINGCMSKPFEVTRGVRQGDPLSCLLFDIAIEPLAQMLRASQLNGLHIRGIKDKTIANLFADDTTSFLNAYDKFHTLLDILSTWCKASKARFNQAKTEIIPIGSDEYRAELIRTRRLSPEQPEIPPNMRIVEEGRATRILGAWFGNDKEVESPWAPVIERIDDTLRRWDQSNPTLEGRKIGVQSIVGGMTQYLTQVQGMPDHIERTLSKRAIDFVWNESKARPINMETLYAPVENGGLNLMNLAWRNEAISIMWLKRYMTSGKERPLWAKIADAIFAHLEKRPPDETRNYFHFPRSGNESGPDKLPTELRKILAVAKKFNLALDGLSYSPEAVGSLPIWKHPKATETHHRNKKSRCLRRNHQMRTVTDAIAIADKRRHPDHRRLRLCGCNECQQAREELKCQSPFLCYDEADKLARTVPGKWNPRNLNYPCEFPDLPENQDNMTQFSYGLNEGTTESSVFRLFTTSPLPINPYNPELEFGDDTSTVTAATDGSCIHNGTDEAQAGAGIYVDDTSHLNSALRLPKRLQQTNQTGEITAILELIHRVPRNSPLHIQSDSKTTIETLTTNRRMTEEKGFVGVKNKQLLQATIAKLRRRMSPTTFEWIKGHAGHQRNEGADRQANIGAAKTRADKIHDKIPPYLKLSGICITAITQKLAYRAIKEHQMETEKYSEKILRDTTERNINRTKAELDFYFGHTPTVEQIWRNMRHKDLLWKQTFFLWKATHGAYVVGKKWLRESNSEEKKDRAYCISCADIESMEHILTQCSHPTREYIWSLAKELWEMHASGAPWVTPDFGRILGCGSIKMKTEEGKDRRGDSRLYRFLIIISAYLIWTERCSRVVGNKPGSPEAALRKNWLKLVNERLALDLCLARPRKGKEPKESLKKLIQDTWRNTLDEKFGRLEDWTSQQGVLVGMKPLV